jgi:hypothetical protein
MKNVNELRKELSEVFKNLKEGKTDVKVAAEMNNTAGKIINTIKVELEYAALKKAPPKIDFLD